MSKAGGVSEEQISAALSTVPLLMDCSKRERKLLAGISQITSYAAGETICQQGDAGLGLNVIIEGATTVLINGVAKRQLVAGDFFGEISLLDGGERSATVRADTAVRCLDIPTWGFRSVLKSQPELALRMLEELARRVRSNEISTS